MFLNACIEWICSVKALWVLGKRGGVQFILKKIQHFAAASLVMTLKMAVSVSFKTSAKGGLLYSHSRLHSSSQPLTGLEMETSLIVADHIDFQATRGARKREIKQIRRSDCLHPWFLASGFLRPRPSSMFCHLSCITYTFPSPPCSGNASNERRACILCRARENACVHEI